MEISPGEAARRGKMVRHVEGGTSAESDYRPEEGYFASVPQPFGPAHVTLAFGPLRLRLEGLAREQSDRLRSRLHRFVDDAGGEADLHVEVRRAGVDGFLKLRRDGLPETYRLERRLRGSRLELCSYEFAACIDARARRAVLALTEPDGPLFDRGLENFLRVLTACFVLERGGFLLHGSGIVRGGRAYVFFGPSGSGKTTVTQLSAGDTILSDDLTLVVRSDDGYEAAGIPFGMSHHRAPDTRASFPIVSLNRLVKSQVVARAPITGAQALAEVAANLPFVMHETRLASRAMDVVGGALAKIPAHELRFRRDGAFWGVVEERCG